MSRRRGQEAEVVEELDELEREVGTEVEDDALPYEIRKDGSIAYFTQEKAAALLREVGS